MFPFFWFWAPQIHFPLSGSVAQQIQPDLSLFFDAIPSSSGNKNVEREAFEIASYGKQLGLLIEAVLGMARKGEVSEAEKEAALARLENIRQDIEQVKGNTEQARLASLSRQIDDLRRQQPEAFAELSRRFQSARV